MTVLPIHPFPARMAPEIALDEIASLERGSVVLDPMSGSGTVLRIATDGGHKGIGFDLDPLAVLMARVWTTPIDTKELRQSASSIVSEAVTTGADEPHLPWIDDDPETKAFINYWFGQVQQKDLRSLSGKLHGTIGSVADALRVALSRIIITKNNGASLARDVSHSRPHKVREENDFPVMEQFLRSVTRIAQQLEKYPPKGNADVQVGDARKLELVETSSVDAVITSPPYLNAIDYLRGHRLSLVWLGYAVGNLRTIRSGSIGAERGPDAASDLSLVRVFTDSLSALSELPRRERRIFDRYVLDLVPMIQEVYRTLKPNGKALLVVGNSCLRGQFIENATVVMKIAEQSGLQLTERRDRELPASRRYLPPPSEGSMSDLKKRMRTETVLTFIKH